MSWIRNESVMWEEFDGETLLVSTKTGARWRLNSAAAALWRRCDGSQTLDGLAVALKQSRDQVREFCRQFEALGLLSALRESDTTYFAGASGNAGAIQTLGLTLGQTLGVGGGTRRRPSPRGNSGPG